MTKNQTSASSIKSTTKEQKELIAETKKMNSLVQAQKDFFDTNITRSIKWRKQQLTLLYNSINNHEKDLYLALKVDLSKSSFESYVAEIGMVLSEISYMKKHLSSFGKMRRVKLSLLSFPGKGYIYPEPYGVSLIMSPWNYPFMLTMNPLVGAIAAGNCAIIKPSRYSPATSLVVESIIKDIFPTEYITVVQGGHLQNTALLNQHFDFIFFTGSVAVGKTVMESAAQHLTPVCLELGGKSPCIIDKTADIEIAARRVVWGKFLNAGQTCIAPDYVLVDSSVKEKFVSAVYKEIISQYGEDPIHNEAFCKIINQKHFDRLTSLVPSAKNDKSTFKIAPTVIELGSLGSKKVQDAPLMQEEIFGPFMPIISYEEIDSVIKFINNRNKPLALYLFTKNKSLQNKIISSVRYGGGCINDTLFHVASSTMPFGGVGESGMGSYHGKASFSTFTHYKSVLTKPFLFDIQTRFAPYGNKLNFIKKIVH